MLKNISSEPIVMRWASKDIILLPGQKCRYQDPRVELRQRAKYGPGLEHTPDPAPQKKDEAVVVLDPVAPEEQVPTIAEPAVSPEAVGGLTCSVCAFEAKTPNGLDVHIRAKHAEK